MFLFSGTFEKNGLKTTNGFISLSISFSFNTYIHSFRLSFSSRTLYALIDENLFCYFCWWFWMKRNKNAYNHGKKVIVEVLDGFMYDVCVYKIVSRISICLNFIMSMKQRSSFFLFVTPSLFLPLLMCVCSYDFMRFCPNLYTKLKQYFRVHTFHVSMVILYTFVTWWIFCCVNTSKLWPFMILQPEFSQMIFLFALRKSLMIQSLSTFFYTICIYWEFKSIFYVE